MLRLALGRIIHMQGLVIVVVMIKRLGMRHQVGQVHRLLGLPDRRQPEQCLPEHGKHQQGGASAPGHWGAV